MLIDYDSLAPAKDPVRRRRTPRASAQPAEPAVPLWDEHDLAAILLAEADAREREGVIRALAEHERLLRELEIVPADRVPMLRDGTELFVAGRRMSRSRIGATIVVTLRDASGSCDVVFTPETICTGELVLVAGVADASAVLAREAWDLRELARRHRSPAGTDVRSAERSGHDRVPRLLPQ